MLKNIERPAAVLFDLDNTLYAYEPAHRRALGAVQLKVDRLFGIGEKDFREAFSEARKEVKNRLGETAACHSRLLYFQRMLELLGLKSQPLHSLDLEQTYWRTFLAGAKLFPSVLELFDELSLMGIPRVLVTDLTAQIQFRKLVFFRLEGSFEALVTSEEAGCEKPNPLVFKLALQKVGISAGPIWMIGDDVARDMRGAKEALNAVTFLRMEPSLIPSRVPDWTDVAFTDFDTVLGLLRKKQPFEESVVRHAG